jgi:hypothetical protein
MKRSFSSLAVRHAPALGLLLALSAACGGATEPGDSIFSGGTGGQVGSSGTAGVGGTSGRGGVSGAGAVGGVSGAGAVGGTFGTGAVGGVSGVGAEGGVAGVGAFGGVSGVGAEGGVAGAGAFGGVGGSGGVSCVRTQDRAQITIDPPDRTRLDCASVMGTPGPGPVQPTVLEGRVTRRVANGFEVDSCGPNADCDSLLTTVTVSAPGLEFWLPTGALVRVTYQITRFFACQQALEVSTIPTWNGLENPYQPNNALVLAVVDGGGTFSSSPYKVDREALGCRPMTQGCGGVPPDEYALMFTSTTDPQWRMRVRMGVDNTIDVSWGGSPGIWSVRNLRSFQTEYCDDYWNFAWFMRYRPSGF